jgi:hypothetical protein
MVFNPLFVTQRYCRRIIRACIFRILIFTVIDPARGGQLVNLPFMQSDYSIFAVNLAGEGTACGSPILRTFMYGTSRRAFNLLPSMGRTARTGCSV